MQVILVLIEKQSRLQSNDSLSCSQIQSHDSLANVQKFSCGYVILLKCSLVAHFLLPVLCIRSQIQGGSSETDLGVCYVSKITFVNRCLDNVYFTTVINSAQLWLSDQTMQLCFHYKIALVQIIKSFCGKLKEMVLNNVAILSTKTQQLFKHLHLK